MLKFEDLVIGNQYRNKKTGNFYTLKKIGLYTEGENDVIAYYEDKDGDPWFRPLGLFMVKFEKSDVKTENEIVYCLCKNFAWSLPEAEKLIEQYSDVINNISMVFHAEDIACRIDFAEKNNFKVTEWMEFIERTEEGSIE